ncbi:MAG: hypothetical protein LAO51_07190 [Acidobacteriia bacterium]|nr:hypothetical protein [Terriglobia bacterium]
MRSRASLRAAAVLPFLMAFAAPWSATTAVAQMTVPDTKPDVYIPEDTGAGIWDGTYVYSCRDFKIGAWLRTRDGKPEMKLRYQSLQAPETFETDWDTNAKYYISGQPATFEVTYKSRDARRIEGSWHWDVQFSDSGRTDDAAFSIYRSGWGRSMVFRFDRAERQVRRGTEVRRYPSVPPPVWTFHKVSKRIDVLWEELPF